MTGSRAIERLRVAVGVVLLSLYAVTAVVNLLDPTREIPTELHALMAIVAGALFGPSLLKRGERDDR